MRYCSICYRSSRPEVFCKKSVLRNFAKFTGKRLCQSLFFNNVAELRPATLTKKRLWNRCFPVNYAKFPRTLFFTEHLRWLLLLLDKIQLENRKKGNLKKGKKNRVSSFSIHIVVFALLSSTVEVGRW